MASEGMKVATAHADILRSPRCHRFIRNGSLQPSRWGKCSSRTLYPTELEQTCAWIVQVQSAEIVEVPDWLQSWCGIEGEPGMKQDSMKQTERLAALDGAEFETAFMEVMIKYHLKADKEGQHCIDRTGGTNALESNIKSHNRNNGPDRRGVWEDRHGCFRHCRT
jgi:hypothetical protein